MRVRRHPGPLVGAILLATAVGGCSSPGRRPETDVVEVERIEVAAPASRPGDATGEAELVLPDADPPRAESVAPPSPR